MLDFTRSDQEGPQLPYMEIVLTIRGLIERGEWKVGRQLPLTRELIAEYGVSRPTVEKAMRDLVKDGYVDGRQGSGRFVSDEWRTRRQPDVLS